MSSEKKQVVLLVEDEALVSITLEEVLAEAGFEFVSVDNGGEAIKALEADGGTVCALLTDIKMPGGIDGWVVAHRELYPLLPVIYMTGDSADMWRAHGVPGSVLLQKPFVPAQLVTALATLLNNVAARS